MVATPTVEVNGPEYGTLDWDAIGWRVHEGNVERLRQRIFTAMQVGDWARARSLQKMMLRSWSNTLVSVRQVTQRNAGRATAGIEGEVALTPRARVELAGQASDADNLAGPASGLLHLPRRRFSRIPAAHRSMGASSSSQSLRECCRSRRRTFSSSLPFASRSYTTSAISFSRHNSSSSDTNQDHRRTPHRPARIDTPSSNYPPECLQCRAVK